MEEASVLCHGPPCFLKENYAKRSFKWDHFSKRDNNLKKNKKRPNREHMSCPKIHTIPLNVTLI